MSDLLLLVHAAATWFMVGLIWFVQVVHYPLFADVGVAGWTAYADRHRSRTTLVVGPVMLVELATAAAIALDPPEGGRVLAWAGLALVGVVWLSTGLVQVPLHGRVAGEPEPRLIRALVLTNWLRTAAWTARGVLALLLIG
ncbi:MAG: hypothetical protein AAFX79_07020 [Planctomycetota bacterium]